jgi:small subunit ribosomal protein S8
MSTVTTDPIADMLSRLRNAIAVHKHEVILPHSKAKESVANLLKKHNYIDDVKVIDATIGKSLKLTINDDQGNARITEIVRVSKPGRRFYSAAKAIPTVKRNRGIVIVSTSQGMMSGSDARKLGVGGEVICRVY